VQIKLLDAEKGIGVFITEVLENGAAQASGLRPGDIVVAIDDKNIKFPVELSMIVRQAGAGADITITIIRDGKKQKISAKLDSRAERQREHIPANPYNPDSKDETKPSARIGIAFEILAEDMERLDREKEKNPSIEAHHLIVTEVDAGSPAEKAGLMVNDIIIGYDGKETKGIFSFTEYIVKEKKPGDTLALLIIRDGKTERIEVVLGGF